MASNQPHSDTEARMHLTPNVAKSRHANGFSQRAIWPQLPTLSPWHKLGWGLFLPLMFAGNVVVATLAWIIVGLVIR
jgi:hypothetical protein